MNRQPLTSRLAAHPIERRLRRLNLPASLAEAGVGGGFVAGLRVVAPVAVAA
jgi:hypothetical protein